MGCRSGGLRRKSILENEPKKKICSEKLENLPKSSLFDKMNSFFIFVCYFLNIGLGPKKEATVQYFRKSWNSTCPRFDKTRSGQSSMETHGKRWEPMGTHANPWGPSWPGSLGTFPIGWTPIGNVPK